VLSGLIKRFQKESRSSIPIISLKKNKKDDDLKADEK
jgi:hypothetical protein